jgi:poly-gamma-glutamate capsule biosynthesis protein CapA/YwtB (metallophosphatase superfamily)
VDVPKHVAILLAGFSLAAHGAESAAKKTAAAAKAAQPDIEFLEYLGTVEGDDENWTEVEDEQLNWQQSDAAPKARDGAKTEAAAKRVTESK